VGITLALLHTVVRGSSIIPGVETAPLRQDAVMRSMSRTDDGIPIEEGPVPHP